MHRHIGIAHITGIARHTVCSALDLAGTARRFTIGLALAGLLLSQTALAQQQGSPSGANQASVSGTVIDAETDESIASATVALWFEADSSLATGAVTDQNGGFEIEGLRPATYYVEVSFVGYEKMRIDDVDLTSGDGSADLGSIALQPDTRQLDEVVVEEERTYVEVGIDKTVYNTREQLASVGGSATDVLENIPSVEVDIDGNISLRGSENVAIHINGRPTSMDGDALASFLQGLPSNMVERVEVIPNPSARHDPEGMSGILNIVLRQDQDRGLGGSLTAGGSTQAEYNVSGLVNFQKGDWSSFLNYGVRRSERDSEGDRYRRNKFEDPLTALSQDDSGERGGFSHSLTGSVEYSLGERSVLSYSPRLSLRNGETENLVAYRVLDADDDLLNRYRRSTLGERHDVDTDHRFSFQHIIDPGSHEFSVEADFEYEIEGDDEFFEQQDLTMGGDPSNATPERQEVTEDEENMELDLEADYVRPLLNGRLEAGYQGSFESTDNTFFSQTFDYDADRYAPDVDLNNSFIYDEQTHSAYGTINQEVGRFGLQAGARLERAFTKFNLTTTNETYKNDYFSIFPSAFALYKIQEGSEHQKQVRLSYSKRVRRPNTWQLNPFGDFEDPLFRREGNPFLTPEYTHAFEVSYVQFSGPATLTLSPYFRRTVDEISWHQFLTDDGVSIVTFRNFDTSDSWGAEAIGTLRLGDWIQAHANFNAYRVVTDGSNVDSDLSNDALGWSARVNGTINVQSDLAVQMSFFYRAPMDIENGRMGSFSRANFAVRQYLFNRRANLSLRVRDPLNMSGFSMQREDDRFYQESDRSWNSREVSLSFTYNFGQQQDRRQRDQGELEGDGGGDMEPMQ